MVYDDDDNELNNLNLKKVIEVFRNFSQSSNKYETELATILIEIDMLKEKLKLPQKNHHYIDCVWSNPLTTCGPNTCRCCFRKWIPKHFANKIVSIMGLDYILWSLTQK